MATKQRTTQEIADQGGIVELTPEEFMNLLRESGKEVEVLGVETGPAFIVTDETPDEELHPDCPLCRAMLAARAVKGGAA